MAAETALPMPKMRSDANRCASRCGTRPRSTSSWSMSRTPSACRRWAARAPCCASAAGSPDLAVLRPPLRRPHALRGVAERVADGDAEQHAFDPVPALGQRRGGLAEELPAPQVDGALRQQLPQQRRVVPRPVGLVPPGVRQGDELRRPVVPDAASVAHRVHPVLAAHPDDHRPRVRARQRDAAVDAVGAGRQVLAGIPGVDLPDLEPQLLAALAARRHRLLAHAVERPVDRADFLPAERAALHHDLRCISGSRRRSRGGAAAPRACSPPPPPPPASGTAPRCGTASA